MTAAISLQFERAVAEYTIWQAVPEDDRAAAPAWWWSTALALRLSEAPLTTAQAKALGLETGATAADGAKLLLDALADQKHQPWPDEFPRRYQWHKVEDETPAG
jgi:hypothetical protein